MIAMPSLTSAFHQRRLSPAAWLPAFFVLLVVGGLQGCATEAHRTMVPEVVASKGVPYEGPRHTLVVGNFQNRSTYMQGLFSSGSDRLGSQAKTLLKSHLQQTGRFNMVDRDSMADLATEAAIAGKKQELQGASVSIGGDVTEFGRRVTGDQQLFGILGSGKTQVAYAKVTLNVVDVRTSQIIYSVSGAGEYTLSNREVLGTGGTAGYDATLNGKVLDLAIREAVNRLVEGVQAGSWTPTSAQ
jgi:curli biogenesis system outer membrane secretion channel CsgG